MPLILFPNLVILVRHLIFNIRHIAPRSQSRGHFVLIRQIARLERRRFVSRVRHFHLCTAHAGRVGRAALVDFNNGHILVRGDIDLRAL